MFWAKKFLKPIDIIRFEYLLFIGYLMFYRFIKCFIENEKKRKESGEI